jgi:predicted DCC family thiol-disulfide oxidoreductase YuxK
MCLDWVRFILKRDPDEYFRFTPIQSAYGRSLARQFGIDIESPETNAVIVGGRAYFKFDSVIQALKHLPRWRWVHILAALPRPLRDWCYDRIAVNRYWLFGRTASCMMPTSAMTRRFLFDNPGPDAAASR